MAPPWRFRQRCNGGFACQRVNRKGKVKAHVRGCEGQNRRKKKESIFEDPGNLLKQGCLALPVFLPVYRLPGLKSALCEYHYMPCHLCGQEKGAVRFG